MSQYIYLDTYKVNMKTVSVLYSLDSFFIFSFYLLPSRIHPTGFSSISSQAFLFVVIVFEQQQAKRMFSFSLSIIKSDNESMMSLKYYFSYNFHKKKYSRNIFQEFGITNVFDN